MCRKSCLCHPRQLEIHGDEWGICLPETDPNSDVIFTIFGSTAFSRLGRKCLHVRKGPWRTIISARNAEGHWGGLRRPWCESCLRTWRWSVPARLSDEVTTLYTSVCQLRRRGRRPYLPPRFRRRSRGLSPSSRAAFSMYFSSNRSSSRMEAPISFS